MTKVEIANLIYGTLLYCIGALFTFIICDDTPFWHQVWKRKIVPVKEAKHLINILAFILWPTLLVQGIGLLLWWFIKTVAKMRTGLVYIGRAFYYAFRIFKLPRKAAKIKLPEARVVK